MSLKHLGIESLLAMDMGAYNNVNMRYMQSWKRYWLSWNVYTHI